MRCKDFRVCASGIGKRDIAAPNIELVMVPCCGITRGNSKPAKVCISEVITSRPGNNAVDPLGLLKVYVSHLHEHRRRASNGRCRVQEFIASRVPFRMEAIDNNVGRTLKIEVSGAGSGGATSVCENVVPAGRIA
jgi:hypothetical protein